MSVTLPDHGTRQRYQRGCHCAECTKANTLYQRSYRVSWRTIHHVDGSTISYREPVLPGLAR